MKILLAHNQYQLHGGEYRVFRSEKELLETSHTVMPYEVSNQAVVGMAKPEAFLRSVYSRQTIRDVNNICRQNLPDIAHIHNFFFMISPSFYYACHRNGIPVVQTLHNYRLLCPNALFFRDQHPCEDCKTRWFAWPGVVHRCYRASAAATFSVAMMQTIHRMMRTWQNQIDLYIALTPFAKLKFIEGGLPAEKIVVKPNFLPADPGERTGEGDYVLFVGRLSAEKGIHTLIKAWNSVPNPPLKIVGSGLLENEVKHFAEQAANVHFVGALPHAEVFMMMKNARIIVFPSECYETFGNSMLEAFACGVPVIGSRLGAMQSLIHHGENGFLFEPGNEKDLVEKVQTLWGDRTLSKQMGKNAREEYRQKYTAAVNFNQLMEIYHQAQRNFRSR